MMEHWILFAIVIFGMILLANQQDKSAAWHAKQLDKLSMRHDEVLAAIQSLRTEVEDVERAISKIIPDEDD